MKLNHKLKALTAAAMLALSGSALADVNPGSVSPGAGEMFFSVWSPTLGQSYTRDLGININNFFVSSTQRPTDVAAGNGVDYAPGSTVSYSAGSVLEAGYKLVFGIDTVLVNSGLLAAADAVWNVVAIRSYTADRLLTTSNVSNPTSGASTGVATSVSRIGTWLTSTGGVNAVMPGTSFATNDSITAASPALAYAGSSQFGKNLGGAGGVNFDSTTAVGGTLAFYEFIETGNARTDYVGGTWQLGNDGNLSYSVAAIPVPGALLLLLSGLLGLVGISRRRSPAGAQAIAIA